MRGREDRAAADQRAIDAQQRARRRAVEECQAELIPAEPSLDARYPDHAELLEAAGWDRLNVEYLRAEWPPSMLS